MAETIIARLTKILDKYQEQSNLLDPHLEAMLAIVTTRARELIASMLDKRPGVATDDSQADQEGAFPFQVCSDPQLLVCMPGSATGAFLRTVTEAVVMDLQALSAMAEDGELVLRDGSRVVWRLRIVKADSPMLAHMAGIGTFVTGGIGGVHRGGEESMDERGEPPTRAPCAAASALPMGARIRVRGARRCPRTCVSSAARR